MITRVTKDNILRAASQGENIFFAIKAMRFVAAFKQDIGNLFFSEKDEIIEVFF